MDIQGWTDGEGPLSILPLLQEDSGDEDDSDEEEEEENLDEDQENPNQDRQNRRKGDLRKEMTYELFSESIWPHMNKSVHP
jgi:TATA-binding protein-associated factor Taf7